jgi:hypothetical protein
MVVRAHVGRRRVFLRPRRRPGRSAGRFHGGAATPSITAPGGRGAAGAAGKPASGGGSGGAILLEASVFDLQGAITANGRGGGQGLGADGADGRAHSMPATGGAKSVDGKIASSGGDGGAGKIVDGRGGSIDANVNPGGGGGGAGRVRINGADGKPDLSRALVSLALSTGCASVGELR